MAPSLAERLVAAWEASVSPTWVRAEAHPRGFVLFTLGEIGGLHLLTDLRQLAGCAWGEVSVLAPTARFVRRAASLEQMFRQEHGRQVWLAGLPQAVPPQPARPLPRALLSEGTQLLCEAARLLEDAAQGLHPRDGCPGLREVTPRLERLLDDTYAQVPLLRGSTDVAARWCGMYVVAVEVLVALRTLEAGRGASRLAECERPRLVDEAQE